MCPFVRLLPFIDWNFGEFGQVADEIGIASKPAAQLIVVTGVDDIRKCRLRGINDGGAGSLEHGIIDDLTEAGDKSRVRKPVGDALRQSGLIGKHAGGISLNQMVCQFIY